MRKLFLERSYRLFLMAALLMMPFHGITDDPDDEDNVAERRGPTAEEAEPPPESVTNMDDVSMSSENLQNTPIEPNPDDN